MIHMIAAVARDGGIGKDNGLLCHTRSTFAAVMPDMFSYGKTVFNGAYKKPATTGSPVKRSIYELGFVNAITL